MFYRYVDIIYIYIYMYIIVKSILNCNIFNSHFLDLLQHLDNTGSTLFVYTRINRYTICIYINYIKIMYI